MLILRKILNTEFNIQENLCFFLVQRTIKFYIIPH